LFDLYKNRFKLRKMKYRFNNIIWSNIVFTFYLITVNLKPPIVGKTVGAKTYAIMQAVYNDNESEIEIFIITNYQLSMKITI